jgi:hypothetical protein
VLRENGYGCDEAIVFYRKTRQRVRVPVDSALVAEAEEAVSRAWDLATYLNLFRTCFPNGLPRNFTLGNVRLVFLNSVCNWRPRAFGLGPEQMAWPREDLASARRKGQDMVLSMHTYPSDHVDEASELARLFNGSRVVVVEMGHTHYNELANEGHTVYAATRSTGQVEEGPVGFSVTLESGVISWKFNQATNGSSSMRRTRRNLFAG